MRTADTDQEEGGFSPAPEPDTSLLNNNGQTKSKSQSKSQDGWDPIPFNLLAYFGAGAMFLLSFNIWDMPKLPYPFIGNLLPPIYTQIPEASTRQEYVNPTLALLIMWGFHFLRRFAEVMFIHVYKRSMSPLECIGAIIYYCFFGFWVGWSVNIHLDYFPPSGLIYALGVLLFLSGEIGNFCSHVKMKRFRSKSVFTLGTCTPKSRSDPTTPQGHVLPEGCLFRFVSCPNYMFEVITWLGFALASLTMASLVFLTCSTITVYIYAYKRHASYKAEFDGKDGRPLYPKTRKAILPFIF